MKRTIIFAHLALFGVNLIYGANYVIAKGVVPDYINPAAVVMTRVIAAMLLFWLINRFIGLDKVKSKDMLRMALCGLCGVAINQLLFYEGLSLTSTINSAIIMTTTPIIVVLLSWPLLGEKLGFKRLLGVGVGLFGALGIILSGGKDVGISPVGDTFIFINAISYAFYLVLVKPLMAKYSPITVLSYVFLFGCAFVVPYSASSFTGQDWNMPPDVMWRMGYIIIMSTCAVYLLNIYALSVVSPAVSSAYNYLQPLLSMLFTYLHDHLYGTSLVGTLGVWHLVFALMIFVGVYLVSRQKPKTA